jgi:hypothetical protein
MKQSLAFTAITWGTVLFPRSDCNQHEVSLLIRWSKYRSNWLTFRHHALIASQFTA